MKPCLLGIVGLFSTTDKFKMKINSVDGLFEIRPI